LSCWSGLLPFKRAFELVTVAASSSGPPSIEFAAGTYTAPGAPPIASTRAPSGPLTQQPTLNRTDADEMRPASRWLASDVDRAGSVEQEVNLFRPS
jgi:hypothetical protein